MLSPDELVSPLARIPNARVLVVGDAMLDRYTYGSAERISQEAPVIVLRAQREETRLGGAANVANMVRGLDASVALACVVGRDDAGRELMERAALSGIDHTAVIVDPERCTTVKSRYVGLAAARHASQILRVDRESTRPLSDVLVERLSESLVRLVPQFDVVLVSDYAKGVCTPAVMQAVIAAGRRAGVPVLVDPVRGGGFAHYRGCTLIKPNRHEAELATNLCIDSPEAAIAAGRKLCSDLSADWALVTLDRDGMAVVGGSGEGRILPTVARDVYDITGAGDMVMAMLGACLGSGASVEIAASLANTAGGLEVEHTGVTVLSRQQVEQRLQRRSGKSDSKLQALDELTETVERHRQAGRSIVFTNGCFDLLHVGHVQYLSAAAELGDVLIVGVNSDESVRRLKGPTRPVIGQRDRAAMLAALACVQHVVVFDDDTPHALLRAIRPDVLVKGGNYTPDQVVGHELVAEYGGRVCVTEVIDGVSTTRIVESLRQGAGTLAALRQAG